MRANFEDIRQPGLVFDDHGTGTPVLFIHGHPFNRSMWHLQVEALRDRFRLLTPDLRGYGDSPLGASRESLKLEDFSEDLAVVLNELGIAKVALVGLSMGGQIAMEFTRAFPDRVTALVLAATFARAETSAGVIERNRVADRILREGMAGLGCEILPRLLGKASMTRSPELAAQVYAMICSTNPVVAAAALRGRAMRRDYREFLNAVRVPSMVVVGTIDGYTTVEEARDMHRRLDGSSLEVFENVGHLPNLEDPERFNDMLRTFLSRI